MRILASQGNFCSPFGISYTCLSLLREMRQAAYRAMYAYGFRKDVVAEFDLVAAPAWQFKLAQLLGASDPIFCSLMERQMARSVKPGDIVWLWPWTRPALALHMLRLGGKVVVERVNSSIHRHLREVERAHRDLGWPPPPRPPQHVIDSEVGVAQAATAVFAPNRFVHESLLEIGISSDRILDSSYGWCPARLAKATVPRGPLPERLRYLFVGSGCVRKGLPILLQAWKDAAVDGDLILAGDVEGDVAKNCAELLNQPNVKQLGYVDDVAEVYRNADVFLLPTYEEGGPQVTFEAAGSGLALVVSPMGTGGAFREELDACVFSPSDLEAWVDIIRRLHDDRAQVLRMQQAARDRAQLFTWEKVAARRFEQLKQL